MSVAQSASIVDTSAFAIVLKALLADTTVIGKSAAGRPRASLHADPLPLRNDGGIAAVRSDTRLPISPSELEARLGILQRLSIIPDDALFPVNCAGTMAPDVPGEESRHKGCPSQDRLVAAIALPRHGDGMAPRGAVSDPSLWTVRVILAGFGPSGINAELRDYVLERTPPGWAVRKMGVVGYWE